MNTLLGIILFLASLIASLFGIGGGVLYTPFQILVGIPFKEAASISLFLIIITSISATIVFRKEHRVDMPLALMLEIPTTLGAFLGGILSHYFSSEFLTFILLTLIIIAAYLLIHPIKRNIFSCSYPENSSKSKFLWKREWEGKILYLDLRCVFPIMFIVGTLISMVGISGGVLKIPIMLFIFGVPMSVAVGSSAFMVGLTAAAGFVGHASVGHVNWQFIILISIPVFMGAQIGSRISTHLKTKKLKKLYGYFLIIVAIITAIRIYFYRFS